jgi:hypothetical protein
MGLDCAGRGGYVPGGGLLVLPAFENGDRFLSAFMSLDSGSFIRGALHGLKKISDPPADIVARIEGCEELAGAGGRKPSDEAFLEAFLVLTGQKS